jgi:hypothetical protein
MPRGLKNRAHQSVEDPAPAFARLRVEYWPIERLKPYERNPRKNDALTYDERERVSGSSSVGLTMTRYPGKIFAGAVILKGFSSLAAFATYASPGS